MSDERAGRSHVHYAAAEGRLGDAEQALREGANPGQPDADGWTPLHFAAQGQHADVAAVLLRAGAPVDAADKHGKTPLAVALFNVRDGEGQVVRVLLDAGADPDRKNLSDISPRDLAEKVANYDLARFFNGV